jgi:hypothetical protein
MVAKIVCGLLALLLAGTQALAAELFYMDHDPLTEKFVGPVGPLVFSGEIEPGDYDHLLAKILDDEDRFLSQNKIILASDGGDVAEALKIAGLVKSLFSEVIVGTQTGRCVSACFFIYAAAQQRGTEGERLVGINRPYIVDSKAPTGAGLLTDASADDTAALKRVRAFLQANEVPENLIEEMFRHPSDDAYWLSDQDEKNLGFRSRSLTRYLAANCAWDDAREREVYAGKRPPDELTRMWQCRARATRQPAHAALLAASHEKWLRDKAPPAPRALRPGEAK